ncbi:MAG: M14 family zinc carboxypeptidase [Candidatus Thermoplasmatota archaeon]|nr:M14 family zinc carboxypeptidase [Candidatus Thermoplasmatota archaeon]
MKKFLILAFLAALLLPAALSISAPVASAQLYIYHNNVTLQQDLQSLAEAHPNLTKLQSIGKSVLGQDLWCIEITNFESPEQKPAIYIDGAHHGNEQLGMELCYSFADFLLNEYESNVTAKELVNARHFYITPLVNPDGNLLDARANAKQVDLNRNYPYQWTGEGDTIGLSSAGSEPEVAANMGIMKKIQPDLYVTFHTGATVMIYPWGYTPDPPPDEQVYLRLCEEIANRTNLEYGQICSPAMYPAFGGSIDWSYGELGIISYCIEVDGEQWVPASTEDIRSRLWQSFDGLLYSAQNVDLLGAKLEMLDLALSSNSPDTFTISFTLSNTGFGNATNISICPNEGDGYCSISYFDVPQAISAGDSCRASVVYSAEFSGEKAFGIAIKYNKTILHGKQSGLWYSAAVNVDNGGVEITQLPADGSVNGAFADGTSAELAGHKQTAGFETAALVPAIAGALLAAAALKRNRKNKD